MKRSTNQEPAKFDALVPIASLSTDRNWHIGKSKEFLRLQIRAALIAIDSMCLISCFMLADAAWIGFPITQAYYLLLVVLPVYLLIATNDRAFSPEDIQRPSVGVRKALGALIVTVAVVLGIAFYLKAGNAFSRVVFGIGMIGAGISVCTARLLLTKRISRLAGPLTHEIVIIDGVTFLPQASAEVLDASQFDLRHCTNDAALMDKLGRRLQHADRIVVACLPERRREWASALRGVGISVEVFAPELEEFGTLGTSHYAKHMTLRVGVGPLGLRDRIAKRLLDLSIVFMVLPILAPLLVVIAVMIKLESPGPALFVQSRIGKGNRLFPMFKFRSMRVEMSDRSGSTLTQRADSRVTRLGAFLRRTSLDEVPQILNVLLGTMSIAGPRPHAIGALAGDALYWEVDQRYWHRHAVKPGMTGLAQIRGFRGTTFQESDLSDRLRADLEYLSGWTIWRDISIIFSTFRVMTHKNAF